MPFVAKDWRDSPGDLTTPITALALEDLEARTTAGIPYENVKWHGAVGDGTGDQTAAIQSAIDACETTGGTVFIPRGVYRVLGSLELHTAVSLVGAGQQASILAWGASLGAGSWALTPDLSTGTANLSRIEDLTFQGPGTDPAVGSPYSDMNGVKISSSQTVERCRIVQFHRGLGVIEDHIQVTNCTITSNTYNLVFLPNGSGGGDLHFTSCALSGASIASVYVEGAPGIAGSFFLGCHLGFAPYGILSATGMPGTGFIDSTVFINCPTEAFGTAAIWGSNATDQIYGSQWIMCGMSQNPAALFPATTYEFLVRGGEIRSCVFDARHLALNFEPGTAYFSTSGDAPYHHYHDRYEMVPEAMLSTNTATFLHRTSGGAPVLCVFVSDQGSSGRFFMAEEAITRGQLVKGSGGSGSCLIYDSDTLVDVPLGVALQSGAANTIIAVATEGFTSLLVADGTISTNRFIKPAATNGRVVQAADWTDGPIVGYSIGNYTAGQSVEAHLRCGTWA